MPLSVISTLRFSFAFLGSLISSAVDMHSFPVEYVPAFYNPTGGGGPGAMGSRSITRNGMTRRGANIPHPEIKAAAVIASSSRRRRQTTKAEGGRTMGWIYTEHVIGCGAMSTQAGAKLQVSPLLLVACLPACLPARRLVYS